MQKQEKRNRMSKPRDEKEKTETSVATTGRTEGQSSRGRQRITIFDV